MAEFIMDSDRAVISRLLVPYTGRKDPKEWLRTFRKVALASEWSDVKCQSMTYAYMQQEADKWLESQPDSDACSLEEFGEKLLKRFSRLSSTLNLRKEFETRRQHKDERAKTFLQELQYDAARLEDEVFDDPLMYRFITGLQPTLREKVQLKIPQTLDEAVEAADYYEALEEKTDTPTMDQVDKEP
jgi:hypothetical protein